MVIQACAQRDREGAVKCEQEVDEYAHCSPANHWFSIMIWEKQQQQQEEEETSADKS